MNETKRTMIMLGILAVIIVMIPIAILINGNYYAESKKKIEGLLASEQIELIYLGRPTCQFCKQMNPVIKEYSKKYNFTYHYIDTDRLDNVELDRVLSYFDQTIDQFGTPYLVAVKNNEIVFDLKGYQGPSYLLNFLISIGFAPEEESLISEDDFLLAKQNIEEKIKSEENELIYIGRPTCVHCAEMKPILDAYMKNKKEYLYIDIDQLTQTQLTQILGYFDRDITDFGTPYTVVVSKGDKQSELRGYPGEDLLYEFLNENGY